MHMDMWNENDSQVFLEHHDAFFPNKEKVVECMLHLIAENAKKKSCHIVDLGSGNGWLLEKILDQYPHVSAMGLDGSENMQKLAQRRLFRFGKRFFSQPFHLQEKKWRQSLSSVDIIISSLCIHHLKGIQKKHFYKDMLRLIKFSIFLGNSDVFLSVFIRIFLNA